MVIEKRLLRYLPRCIDDGAARGSETLICWGNKYRLLLLDVLQKVTTKERSCSSSLSMGRTTVQILAL